MLDKNFKDKFIDILEEALINETNPECISLLNSIEFKEFNTMFMLQGVQARLQRCRAISDSLISLECYKILDEGVDVEIIITSTLN